jgi:hypothetical protein
VLVAIFSVQMLFFVVQMILFLVCRKKIFESAVQTFASSLLPPYGASFCHLMVRVLLPYGACFAALF